MTKGFILYVIGSSGVGKDSILNESRKKLNFSKKFLFAKRFITRPNVDGNEQHIQLSLADFNHRIDQGLFSLFWDAHENFYGIGIEIEYWTASGYNVIVNGSRAYLEIAKLRYPNLKSILISADKKIIYKRLIGRKRESHEMIEKRLERNKKFEDLEFDHVISNENSLEKAVNSFVQYAMNLSID
jgi:ribose 1,5-bisphosphokinase